MATKGKVNDNTAGGHTDEESEDEEEEGEEDEEEADDTEELDKECDKRQANLDMTMATAHDANPEGSVKRGRSSSNAEPTRRVWGNCIFRIRAQFVATRFVFRDIVYTTRAGRLETKSYGHPHPLLSLFFLYLIRS